MKRKIFLAVIHLAFGTSIFAQMGINSITVVPSNPSPTDTIRVYATSTFSSGGCNALTQVLNQSGNTFDATANHCVGPLAVICTSTDTFKILPQAAGFYKFVFNLYSGGSAPCNSIFADKDSVFFTVGGPTSVQHYSNIKDVVAYHSNGRIYLASMPDDFKMHNISIYNSAGQLIFSQKNNTQSEIAAQFIGGLYIIVIDNGSERLIRKLAIQ